MVGCHYDTFSSTLNHVWANRKKEMLLIQSSCLHLLKSRALVEGVWCNRIKATLNGARWRDQYAAGVV